MLLGLTTALCIVVFVICAFMLRARMDRLSAFYETRAIALAAADANLLPQGDVATVEREMRNAARHAAVMRRNAALFRLLWPKEYDRAFYSGQRLIAQCNRIVVLASR